MKHFLLYVNQHKDHDLQITKKIKEYFEERGQKVSLCIKTSDWRGEQQLEATDIPQNVDCMLVLGGDGTVLQAARETRSLHIPLIGVNLGTLGYMTQIEPNGLEYALERLIAGDYEQESRMMLHGSVFSSKGQVKEGWALNDIVIARKGSLQVIRFNVFINGKFLHTYDADGVIITTPTGSTGYNLSAGGPLVEPSARLMMLTPICPHTLIQRSIILSAADVVEIEIPKGKEGQPQLVEASFDGAALSTLETGDRICIVKAGQDAEFIQLSPLNFLEILHRKMNE